MSDDSLNELLKTTPEPDANAKRRALNLAIAEFKAAHQQQTANQNSTAEKQSLFQGFWHRLRPMGNNTHTRRSTMSFAQKKLIITGMASCSIAVFGLLLINHYPLQPVDRTENDLQQAHVQQPPLVPQEAVAEEVVVTGMHQRLESAPEVTRSTSTEAPMNSITSADAEAFADRHRSEPLEQAAGTSANKVIEKPALALVRAQESTLAFAPAGPTVMSDMAVPPPGEFRNRFSEFKENTVISVTAEPVSTFSTDVDTAAYGFMRRSLNEGRLPAKDAVRTEEIINYFDYQYPLPTSKTVPFQPNVVVVDSPWKAGNKLIHIGIKGYQIPAKDIPRSNLVFLLDVSGSMSSPDKLPLVQQSMGLLLDNLQPDDTVAIVVYAGAAGTVLSPTKVKDKHKILTAIQQLQAGGSTAGAQGIQLAYQLAEANFDPTAVNRIILATDGDFNVGHTGDSDLKTLVERKRDQGIYLSILGFGQGNYQDAMMQTLAQNGNGVAAYIDTLSEAQKVLVHEATSTLFPIASDVKIQVEFNPATVAEYRLIGYETRALNREDFNNDKVDAGDIGAGHRVTAIYEITPVGAGKPLLEPNRYQSASAQHEGELSSDNVARDNVSRKNVLHNKKTSSEYAFLRIRYKLPGEKNSRLIEQVIDRQQALSLEQKIVPDSPLQEAGFATAVAGFAQLLRGSKFVGDYSYDDVIELAQKTKGKDDYGYRTEFVQLVRKAKMAKEL